MSEEIKESVKMEENNGKKAKKPKSKGRKIFEWVLTIVFVVLIGGVVGAEVSGKICNVTYEGYSQYEGTQKSTSIDWMYNSFHLFTIETDSMEPLYPVGSAVVVNKQSPEQIFNDFNNPDIEYVDITFFDAYDGEYSGARNQYKPLDKTEETVNTAVPMTHRIIEIIEDTSKEVGQGRYIIFTAGINASNADGSENFSRKGQYQVLTEEYIIGRVTSCIHGVGQVMNFILSPIGLIALILIPTFYLIITSVLDIFKTIKDPETDEEALKAKYEGGQESNGEANASGDRLSKLSDEDKERLKKQMLEEMLGSKKGK